MPFSTVAKGVRRLRPSLGQPTRYVTCLAPVTALPAECHAHAGVMWSSPSHSLENAHDPVQHQR